MKIHKLFSVTKFLQFLMTSLFLLALDMTQKTRYSFKDCCVQVSLEQCYVKIDFKVKKTEGVGFLMLCGTQFYS